MLRAGSALVAIHAYGRRIEAMRAHDRFVMAMRRAAEFAAEGRIVDWRTKYRARG
ncbi:MULTISPECIES: hypothetical protein [unclassified Amycolatopsis]|uniref:hypothetical protein n=1 Tax=unclassified Amycolatopsis TaxID=2618356 RepID=UPI001C6A50A6|nr:hypothetical protein [Amycolatopsis sp. DSM 110486]QYN19284.1 hypothetical protein K1T34_42760 [Amycolatopsis sp. DSM 110486]